MNHLVDTTFAHYVEKTPTLSYNVGLHKLSWMICSQIKCINSYNNLSITEILKMASSKLEYLKKYMSKEDNSDSTVKKKKKKKRVKDPGG